MKIKKRIILFGIVGVLVVVVLGIKTMLGDQGKAVIVDYSELYTIDLINSISAKGIIESKEKRHIYSSLNANVRAVNVKEGDKVTVGDVLGQLDTEGLELDLAQQKADLSSAQQSNLNQLQNNQRIYEEAIANLENGSNGQVVSAMSNLKNTELTLKNATKAYNDALRDFETSDTTQITTAQTSIKDAEIALETATKTYNDTLRDFDASSTAQMAAQSNIDSAKLDLETKTTDYDNAKLLYEVGAVSKSELDQSETAYKQAQNKYHDAKIAVTKELEQAETAYKQAENKYQNALSALEDAKTFAAETAANQDLEKYASNVENAQIAVNNDSKVIAIQKLENQIQDAYIKAPISGTITAVYANEGTMASGLLFVIEDTNQLEITTKFREYDIGRVTPGLIVNVRTDYTGDNEYGGIITEISPTTLKNANGNTLESSDVEFAAKVSVANEDTELKIGTNANLSVITDKNENVYCVPYDYLAIMENGETVVYVAQEKGGKYIANAIIVSTGMETDFYIEIASDELTDGMKVLKEISAIQNGMTIQLGLEEQI